MGKRKIKVQALKTFKKEQLRGREKNMKGYVKIYATKYIYPFGPPTLSRQNGGGGEKKKNMPMDENTGRVFGKHFKK